MIMMMMMIMVIKIRDDVSVLKNQNSVANYI